MLKRGFYSIILVAWLNACASQIPPQIREAPAGSPSEDMVRGQVQQHLGTVVRWGGTIVAVENRPGRSWVELVARPLQSNGRPAEEGQSSGRFLARYDGFLDPVVYSPGRALTVVGKIAGEERRPIDKFDYSFPVVAIENYYLWPPPSPAPPYQPPPYWDDPWWPYPYYPWYYRHRYPYWW